MTNVQATTTASVAEQGAHVAPAKASSKKQAAAHKGALKARKTGSVKPKKDAPKTTEARPGSKSAKVLALLARTNGASLTELMKAIGWQAHSIRGHWCPVKYFSNPNKSLIISSIAGILPKNDLK